MAATRIPLSSAMQVQIFLAAIEENTRALYSLMSGLEDGEVTVPELAAEGTPLAEALVVDLGALARRVTTA